MSPHRAVALSLLILSSINLAYIAVRSLANASASMKLVETGEADYYSYQGHDHPPSLPIPASGWSPVLMTVEESVHYPLLGDESDSQWASLSSAGYGYVRLGPNDRLFAVTMFHELHCLRMLNYAFGKSPKASLEHVQHCLAYLKDGIMCDADLTIEPGNFEERDFESQRTGATHVCKDWAAVYEAMDQNYYDWKERAA